MNFFEPKTQYLNLCSTFFLEIFTICSYELNQENGPFLDTSVMFLLRNCDLIRSFKSDCGLSMKILNGIHNISAFTDQNDKKMGHSPYQYVKNNYRNFHSHWLL